MNKLIILSLLIVLSGCENPAVRRDKLVAQNPGWDAMTVSLIQEGKISKGMTKDQVRAAWGRHCYSCTGTTKSAHGSSWEYTTQVVFFNLDGKVLRWSPK